MRGFTLLELLIVLVIISFMVSMAALNTSSDPRIDRLNEIGEELKFVFEVASDEAIFKDKTLGVEFSTGRIGFFERTFVADKDDEKTRTPGWVKYEGSIRNPYILDEEIELSLKIDGQESVVPFDVNEKEPKPKVVLQATGEQNVIAVELSIAELGTTVKVRGNGTGRFYKEVEQDEE